MAFPTLSVEADIKYDDEYIKPVVKTKFDGNYAQTRPKYTKASNDFNPTYKMITEADKNTLKTFFNTNSGNSFDWTNPTDKVVYTVRFGVDRLKFKNITVGYYSVDIPLEEV